MALDQSALLEVLDALKAADVGDRVRSAAETIYQALIEAELTDAIGAGLHERSAERTAQRNGHRTRTLPRGPHRLAEAQAHLAREVARQQAKLDRRAAVIATGRRPVGRPPVPVEQHPHVIRARRAVEAALAEPPPRELPATTETRPVANTSDPQSRLMPTRCGFVQGYNAQVAITADQVIVALQVGQSPNDFAAFVPMMRAAQAAADLLHQRTGDPQHVIGTVLADAGYASDANLAEPGPDRLIALGKSREQAKAARTAPTTGLPASDATPRQAMDHRLRTPEAAALYKRRGATVEPGIGNLKKLIDRFSRRGLDAVTSELHLAATAFNILKIYRAAHG